MMYDLDTNIVPNDWTSENAIIKVVGVGGGGCNAVNYMYRQNIQGCSFIVCNTDAQALQTSEVPVKIQLGQNGLGAGTDPTAGRNAALEAQDEIARKVLDCGTQMLFITAGMGGGTGTGASPVIAKMAKERGILTVAVVTIPFKNEGNESQSKAVDGIHELEKNVDALLIINNEKLYQFFGDTLIQEAFPKADEVLATAVRGIIEVISCPGYINVDFQDVCKMMRNSGMALMGSGEGTGPDRLDKAVKGAFESPLLNDFDLKTAKNVLVNITTGNNENGAKMSDLEKIDDMISQYTGTANHFKKGIIWDNDPEFGDKIRITAIVTGFTMDLGGLGLNKDLGNLVIIDEGFEWETPAHGEEVSLPGMADTIKIGYNNSDNAKYFNFASEKKPVLCIAPGEKKADLENIPAIRRKH
ncbi:MAG: cell division protein FtsZ [Candidatus Cryptobacteroides sp.]|jgi:cell division protein FtsZ|nr:cell division protein FtsZ [Candidatus Cryptobacteroides sp.]MEE3465527.1 cell division protein FtsZ [Candidatus Cryptobacteroides sp.]